MAIVTEQSELWHLTFKLSPTDESSVKLMVRGEHEAHVDDVPVLELLEKLERWPPLREAFYKQLRSALVSRNDYTATVRTTRREMREMEFVSRYMPNRPA